MSGNIMATTSVKTVQRIDTQLFADSVEWCPHTPFQDILLCGTYQLDEKQEADGSDSGTSCHRKQTRHGKLCVYRLKHGNNNQSLQRETTLDMPGILDIKWCPAMHEDGPLVALVNSAGHLQMYRLLPDSDDRLQQVSITELGSGCLGLSLDWSDKLRNGGSNQICSSSSDGCIHVHSLDSGDLVPVSSWKAHDFEAWITAFNNWDNNFIYTGGDDCKLKGWDTRTSTDHPVFTSKRHTMGVTSIQSSPVREHILCTGSYDEQLLVWDSRNMKRCLSETSLGGGIWRIKWKPQGTQLLTATMYNGFHLLDATVTDEKLPVLYHYTQQEILAYGADWCCIPTCTHTCVEERKKEVEGKTDTDKTFGYTKNFAAVCSFYDHSLQLWEITQSCPTDVS